MSTNEDIKRVNTDLTTIEAYVKNSLWNPNKNKECANKLFQTDVLLNQLEGDKLSEDERKQISKLRRRFEEVKFKLPSPPWSK